MSETTQTGLSELESAFFEHQGRVLRAAYRVTGNLEDAEDVLQTVFLRLSRHPETLRAESLASYLYRAGVNAALDLIRARREVLPMAADGVAERLVAAPATRPDLQHEADELRAWLRGALGRLSPRAAEVFVLRYLEGHDNRDIARLLGTSRMVVAVTLHRTRHRLRKELGARERGER